MAESTSHNDTMPENEFTDLMDSMNSATLEELKARGPIGEFAMKLVEKARAEKQTVSVKGVNGLTTTIKYGNETVDFILKPSVDPGDAPVEHAHYEVWAADYKKPWVRSLLPEQSNEWLTILPLNFADLTQELTGQDLKLNVLEQQFPKLKYGEMMTVIDEATGSLDEFFKYKLGQSAGAWGFYMDFKSEDMYKKYLANDPDLMGKLKAAATAYVPAIMSKLQALSAQKAA